MKKWGWFPFLIVFIAHGLSFPQSKKIISLEYREKKLPFGLVEKTVKQEPEITVVLSGGGSRGLTQIGFLKALVENNIPITNIVGTSIGSIIGGLYASGYSIKQLDSIVRYIPWDEFLTIKDEASRRDLFVDQKITEDRAIFALRLQGLKPVLPTAINTGQNLSNYLNLLVLNAPIHVNSSFNELKVGFKAVCTDLISGRIVVLNNGSLSQAMRASASVSLFLLPVKIDTLLLVDGGLVANIPVKVAKDAGSDFIIALNTTSPLYSEDELLSPWNVADQLVSIPMRLLSSQQLEYADIVIEPELGNRKNNDFKSVDSLVEIGYKAADQKIKQIKENIRELYERNLRAKEFYLKNIAYNLNADKNTKNLLFNYSIKDSVSSYEILNDLYLLHKTGKYDSIYVEVENRNNITYLNVVAKENPTIKKIIFDGITLIDSSKVDSILSLIKNEPYNPRRVFEHICEVLSLYRTDGYSLADLEEENFDPSSGKLYLKFTEGIISEIVIEGNEKTNSPIIRRELPMEIGDYFKYEKAEQGFANLRSTNLFRDINLTENRDSSKNKLLLKVLEKPSSLLRFGLRIDNENLTQMSFDLRDENLAGTGTELGLLVAGGIRNRNYLLEHKANRIFNTYFTYKVRAFFEFNDVYTYKEDTVASKRKFSRSVDAEYRQIFRGFSLGIGTQVGKFGNLIFESKYGFDEVKNKVDYEEDIYKINIATLLINSTIDSQDKYPYPESGFLIKTSYETAQKIFGGDVSYTKFHFDYKSHFTIKNLHTFSPRLAIGVADNTLPLGQQFSLGGQNSFFGLRDYEFRGRQIFLSSLQYRLKLPFKLFFDTYLKLRYDMGAAWTTREHIRLKDLRHGTGATVSFDTPLGPADFSVGRSFLFTRDLPVGNVVLGPVFFYFTIGYYY